MVQQQKSYTTQTDIKLSHVNSQPQTYKTANTDKSKTISKHDIIFRYTFKNLYIATITSHPALALGVELLVYRVFEFLPKTQIYLKQKKKTIRLFFAYMSASI